MGAPLKRHIGAPAAIQAGEYYVDPEEPSPTTKREVIVCCPRCAGTCPIAESHEIRADGRAFPMFECPTVTCGFNDFITLELYSWTVLG